ncbi:MAG: 8-amino-7-oxononanoate synthase [Fibrobacteres bacterium]|nr:8-amino-7-oxononanoate synthase [Fibrobacterota bacterium]
MELNSSMAIGYVMKKLIQEGVTDFDKIADALQELKDLQNKEELFSYDRFTESGSDSKATVITQFSNQKKECILWCLNHYLGLNRNPNVIAKTKAVIEKFGTGCGTSAMSGGMSSLHKEIETRVKTMLGKERVILFPTGYSANLGALSAIPGKNDLILFDHESHASIIDGCRLSGKQWLAFHHNDVENLEAKLKRAQGKYENILVVVESAYSMSGDLCPIKEIVALKKKYPFYLYVDEAHTFGFYGENGRGYCQENGVAEDVDFIMSTLSKSTASIGGFIATKEKYCTLLQCYAGSYLFQACISPGDAAAVLASLDEIETNPGLIRDLHAKSAYFRKNLLESGFDLGRSQSPIVPIYVPELKSLYAFGREIFDNGIFSVSVAYPAVKLTEGRLRFIVNTSHTYQQIDRTLEVLKKVGSKYGIISQKDGA